ncbi:MAG: hypothetical protein IJ779_07325 [Ruminococcus sp.]|nr:hypothetical protein [Ruminococcus sp.]
MKGNGRKIYNLSRLIVVIGLVIGIYTVAEGSFFRRFGEDELIIFLIFYALFTTSLVYSVGYFVYNKLPPAESTAEEPKWFRQLFVLSCSPLPVSLAISVGSYIITGILGGFSHVDRMEFLLFGWMGILLLLVVIPVIPVGNAVIIIHHYRRKQRSKQRNELAVHE